MVLAGFLGEVGAWSAVILGVGLLVFIHELGHFLVAKWAGVKVLAFSLGFGPVLAGFRRGDTHYRLSAIPLGGYVKMSGETELPEGGYAPDDYPAKPVWKRTLIILAGVVMNALLGFVLFAAALSWGFRPDPVVVGAVAHGGPAWEAGILPGDRVLRADGRRLLVFPDLQYATLAGEPLALEVERDGRVLTLPVTPRLPATGKTPTIGVFPAAGGALEAPPGGSAARAGFRTGDRLVAVEGVPAGLSDFGDEVFNFAVLPLAPVLRVTVEREGRETPLEVAAAATAPRTGIVLLRDSVDAVRAGGGAESAGWRKGDRPLSVGGREVRGWYSFLRAALRAPEGAAVRVARGGETADLPLPGAPAARLALLRDLRFAEPPSPTAVEVWVEGPAGPDGLPGPSPAEAAGVPNGARLTAVGGFPVTNWSDVVRRVSESKGGPVEFAWAAEGGEARASVVPAPFPVHGLGALDLSTLPEAEEVAVSGPVEVATLAFSRCVVTTRQIVATVAGIFRGSVDKDNLGGPIMIAQVAKKGTQAGLSHFLWILAVLSINLMFLNILPIPLLDGGQLALLAVEAVTRRPPSEAVVGLSQWVGLLLLLGLMVMVTFNDIARMFGP